MTWIVPKTEEEWMECLSAYLDGEMSLEDRALLESHLKTDPERSGQLEAYRHTSIVLQGWNVEVPEPQPGFLRQIKQSGREKREPFWKQFLFPNMHWFPFSVGMATGVFALMLVQHALFLSKPAAPSSSSLPETQQPVYNVFISQNQAENLMNEVTAAGLAGQLKTQLRGSQWKQAAGIYQTLLEKYSDTKAFHDLKNTPALQTFIGKYERSRGI